MKYGTAQYALNGHCASFCLRKSPSFKAALQILIEVFKSIWFLLFCRYLIVFQPLQNSFSLPSLMYTELKKLIIYHLSFITIAHSSPPKHFNNFTPLTAPCRGAAYLRRRSEIWDGAICPKGHCYSFCLRKSPSFKAALQILVRVFKSIWLLLFCIFQPSIF